MTQPLKSSPNRGGGPREAWWRGLAPSAHIRNVAPGGTPPPPASLVPLPVPGRMFA